MIEEILKHSTKTMLLFSSLREAIVAASAEELEKYTEIIWYHFKLTGRNLLLQECELDDQNLKNIVAECLGKLAITNLSYYLPELQVPYYYLN